MRPAGRVYYACEVNSLATAQWLVARFNIKDIRIGGILGAA